MKISKIYIRDFEQFQDVELDFTDPNTGKPLEKVCFIGTNGTGKSKILKMLNGFLNSVLFQLRPPFKLLTLGEDIKAKIIYEIVHTKKKYVVFYFERRVEILDIEGYQKDEKSELLTRLLSLESMDEIRKFPEYNKLIEGTRHNDFLNELIPGNSSNDLIIYSPDESNNNGYLAITDVPQTNVNEALSLFQNLPVFVEVSPNTVKDFWKLLVFNLKRRDEERETYERTGENINKTKAQLINEFDKISPKILDNLAVTWDKILAKAALEFDVQGASNPIQLSDNLKAYIRLKKTKKIIPYRNLSTGIRNFIFRVGHIYSLYFNRQVNRGFLFIDEPENGFFPDFLFDLMKTYQNITIDKNGNNNTQMFFATHNPIVAGQFHPYERIILDWNENGSVIAKKGFSPIGDDPNDVLSNDFELKNLMGPEGRKMWEKYQDLKKNLIREKDKTKKDDLINQINQIGSLYNFS